MEPSDKMCILNGPFESENCKARTQSAYSMDLFKENLKPADKICFLYGPLSRKC